jgi:hypothetical protein
MAGSRERLDGHDLIIQIVRIESRAAPEAEMVGHGDGATGALLLAHGEVLLESRGARDGGLVVAGVGADLVGAAVGSQGAETLGLAAGVVVAVVLHDVVLGLRRVHPAVDGEVAAAVGRVAA